MKVTVPEVVPALSLSLRRCAAPASPGPGDLYVGPSAAAGSAATDAPPATEPASPSDSTSGTEATSGVSPASSSGTEASSGGSGAGSGSGGLGRSSYHPGGTSSTAQPTAGSTGEGQQQQEQQQQQQQGGEEGGGGLPGWALGLVIAAAASLAVLAGGRWAAGQHTRLALEQLTVAAHFLALRAERQGHWACPETGCAAGTLL